MEEIKLESEEYQEPKFCVEVNTLPYSNSVVNNGLQVIKQEDCVYDDIEPKCILNLDKQINFDNGVTPQPFLFLPVKSEMQEVGRTSVPNGISSAACGSTSNVCSNNIATQEITSIHSGFSAKTLFIENEIDIEKNFFPQQGIVNMQDDDFKELYPVSAEIYENLNSRENNLNSYAHGQVMGSPFVCKICRMSFKENSDLIQHAHTHIYPCEVCKKMFTDKDSLERHMILHTKGEEQKRTPVIERVHVCETCNKSFFDKYRLGRHMRTHTGERPFTCELCKKSFSQKSNLNKHKRLHFQ